MWHVATQNLACVFSAQALQFKFILVIGAWFLPFASLAEKLKHHSIRLHLATTIVSACIA